MKAPRLLEPAEIDILFQIQDTVYEYLPWLENAVAKGLPYNEHLNKAKEQRDMIDSTISLLQLERTK